MKSTHPSSTITLSALCTSVALLAACGGNPDPEPTAAPAPVSLSGVVADGPLAGATVCYDLNDNAACDASEPTSAATTDADGRFSFDVAAADAGKHGIVATVPATAVDKDTGAAVGTAFTLKAPAISGAIAVVSPLTTLVVDFAAYQGLSAADAEAAVKSQLGLSNSPLANFVAAADTQAGRFAKTINTVIIEVTKLADAASVSPEARQALVASVLATADLNTLATLVNAAGAGTPAQVAAAATQAVLAERNLNATTVADQAGFAAATATPVAAAAPGPFVSVRRFTYTDANNYQLQAFVGDSTPGADGSFKASEVRANQVSGAAQPFNLKTAATRSR